MSTDEAEIVINKVPLTNSQSMAVRMAITRMETEMSDPDVFGTDDHNKRFAKEYHDRLLEVWKIITT